MVLQPSNGKKRPRSENVPPQRSLSSALKTSWASLANPTMRDAASRRRARANAVGKTTRYTLEQSRRKSALKNTPSAGPSSAKKPLKSRPAVRPHTTVDPPPDVEMRDAAPESTAKKWCLPCQLLRPDYQEVSADALTDIDPSLADVDLHYIRDFLQALGPSMLKGLSTVQTSPPAKTLPNSIAISMANVKDPIPSHMLAILPPPQEKPSAVPTRVCLYPIHSIILAAYCSKLPPLPVAVPSASPMTDSTQPFDIPLYKVHMPSPETFSRLYAYLYTKRKDILLNSFFLQPIPHDLMASFFTATAALPHPTTPWVSPLEQVFASHPFRSFAISLAQTYSGFHLLKSLGMIHGLWKNVCALGIFDDDLWDTMDLLWHLHLGALGLATGNSQIMNAARPAATPQPQPVPGPSEHS